MNENLRIWSKVERTNPAHTKHVNQRGGFTAVSASYQILAATEMFGPIGEGWGYTTGEPVIIETLITIPVTLWHGNRDNTYGPMWGCEEWKDAKGRIDSDAPKKATTDGITKLLSQLGFNADVFLGKFDDQKYVEQMKREFSNAADDPPPKFITEAQRTELMAMFAATGVASGTFLEVGNISDLREVPFEQFDAAKRWINQRAEEARQKKAA